MPQMQLCIVRLHNCSLLEGHAYLPSSELMQSCARESGSFQVKYLQLVQTHRCTDLIALQVLRLPR